MASAPPGGGAPRSPTMLIRLSRTLFWLAAASAAAALAAAEPAGTWLTALAGGALLGAFACWRLAAAQRRADHAEDDPIAAGRLDEAGLLEVAARAARVIGPAATLDAALLAALEVLRSELGCRDAVAHRVLSLEPPLARLVTLIDAGPGGRGVEHRVRLDHEPLGTALRDGRPAGRPGGPWALPVAGEGAPVAVLQLGEPALEADPQGLATLFELVGLQLTAAARREPRGGPGATASAADVTSSRPAATLPLTGTGGAAPDVEENRSHPQVMPDMLRSSSPTDLPAPPADLPGAAVLDATALEKLRELDPRGDNRLVQRVMQAFEGSAARLLPQLREAQRVGDPGGIRHVVHTLKASSASIGALLLSQQCAEIETCIRLGESDGMDGRLAAVYDEMDKVLQAVRLWTGEAP